MGDHEKFDHKDLGSFLTVMVPFKIDTKFAIYQWAMILI